MTSDPRSIAVPASATGATEDGGAAVVGSTGVEARGQWEQAWRRFRRDRVAVASGIAIIVIILVSFIGAPIAVRLLGHGPNDINTNAVVNYAPVGPMSQVANADGNGQTLYVLGASDTIGRDELLRILYGAQVSLEVAIIATFVGLMIGLVLGTLAGFYGGVLDTIVSRMTEIVMAFPLLLFAIALAATIGDRLNSYTLGVFAPGVLSLVIVISAFTWYYAARVVRSQVLALREKEFIEAARMVGASNLRIMRTHLLPHLIPTLIVLGTLTVATNILFEAALSYLGVGLPPPNASWGNLLSSAVGFYTVQPWLMVWPGLAILLVTLAFNLLGDGLRDAIDPRSSL